MPDLTEITETCLHCGGDHPAQVCHLVPDDPDIQNWMALWSSLKEIGAALRPFVDRPNPPPWAAALESALDAANAEAEEKCAEAEIDV